MGKTLSTDDIGSYFADAFREVALPAFNNITEKLVNLESDVKTLKSDMKDVKGRLGNVEEGLKEVKEDMVTKEDLKKLETTLTKRMDRMSDVQK